MQPSKKVDPRLPQEIMDIIIEFCHQDRATLRTASLVFLFGSQLGYSAQFFDNLSSRYHTLIPFVRAVEIRQRSTRIDWPRVEQTLSYTFSHITSLSILLSSDYVTVPLDVLRLACSFLHLQNLTIKVDGTLRLRIPFSGVYMRLPDTLVSLNMLSALEHPGWIYPLFQWMLRHQEPDGSTSLTNLREMVLCTFASGLAPVGAYLTSHCAGLEKLYLVLGRDFFFQEEKLIPLHQLPSLQLLVLSGHVPVRRPRLFRFARCLRHLRSSHLKTVGFDLGIDDLESGEAERILPALDLFFASREDNHTSDHFEFSSLRNVVVNIFLSLSIDLKESEDTESRRFSVHQSLKEQVEKFMPCCHESGLLLVEVLSGDAQKSLLRHDIKSYYDKILRCRNK
ncbi:hypothetical protein VKT23_010371 [Stygiomarasmius scandens]|uniref:F-box protein n=1 Tax=Marasmiellus scandens TaxID=2682957 RepID=A0ABR1JG73_9AGAR